MDDFDTWKKDKPRFEEVKRRMYDSIDREKDQLAYKYTIPEILEGAYVKACWEVDAAAKEAKNAKEQASDRKLKIAVGVLVLIAVSPFLLVIGLAFPAFAVFIVIVAALVLDMKYDPPRGIPVRLVQ